MAHNYSVVQFFSSEKSIRFSTPVISLLVSLLFLICQNSYAERSDIVIADFESGTWEGWHASGDAFGETPAQGTLQGQLKVTGYIGDWLVNSFVGGDKSTGVLESDTFVIDRTHINFMIGGGSNGGCRMELWVDGAVARTICPEISMEDLKWNCWEVSALQGKQAVLRIIDNETEGWGHINIDHIVQADNIVIGGFDNGTYDGWEATGNAFGAAPATGTLSGQNEVSGFNGAGLVNTFLNGDASRGTLTSPVFTIVKPYINFRLGGGFDKKLLHVDLIVDDEVVRRSTPIERTGRTNDSQQERLYCSTWDVKEFIGKEAVIEIVDASIGSWGHINADDFIQSDYRSSCLMEDITISITADALYLMVPVQNDADAANMIVKTTEGNVISQTKLQLARNDVDRYIPIYIGAYSGEMIEVYIDAVYTNLSLNDMLHTSDDPEFDKPSDPYYPAYHHAPVYGWMNDPNGMVYYNGTFHLFYQYNPYHTYWSSMHWGHATSPDLIHWQQQPIALYPDDYGDMFSGCIVVDELNTAGFGTGAFVAIYTSTAPTQSQSLAYSNDEGKTWHKYGAPVLRGSGDFRDPKVFWYSEQNCWVMILAAYNQAKIYSSPNLKQWTLQKSWGSNVGSHVGIWECPDLIQVPVEGTNEKKWVMLISVNNGAPAGGSGTQYFIGDFTMNDYVLSTDESVRWVDYGKDNYAGVTWSGYRDAKGRPLFIGWMNNWQYAADIPTDTSVFRGQNTFPRALSVVNTPDGLRLKSEPVNMLDLLRSENVYAPEIGVIDRQWQSDEIVVMNEGTAIVELELGTQKQGWKLTLSNLKQENVVCGFNSSNNQVYVDRRNAGIKSFSPTFAAGRHVGVLSGDEYANKATLLIDHSSVELFVNDGRIVITDIVFPNVPYNRISISPEDGSLDVKKLTVTGVTLDNYHTSLPQTNYDESRTTLRMVDGHIYIYTPQGVYNLCGVKLQ